MSASASSGHRRIGKIEWPSRANCWFEGGDKDNHGGAGPSAPTHRLVVTVGTTQWTVVIDPITGRPNAQIDSVVAYYQLVEIATGKTVVSDTTFAHVDYDIPGQEQRFAKQRAQRDAEDRATKVVAERIRNRLASYFVAGT